MSAAEKQNWLIWGAPRAVGVVYALLVAYGLFVLFGLFQFFGVPDPALWIWEKSPWPRDPWNWLSWNVVFTKENTDMLGLQRRWWAAANNNWPDRGLVTSDLRFPLQLIAAFLILAFADWFWRMTLGRLVR